MFLLVQTPPSHMNSILPIYTFQLSHLLIVALVLVSFCAHTIIEQDICFQNLFNLFFVMLGVLF
jgi:hypothetical protein